ncbi:MAG TPA: hydrophobe/amphiphile efflux-1 family RND transporter [Sutterella sp.]|nr:hydrophobe/amphiphile efflux-1 family RND transporter [Sutterella sp.]
MLSQFCIRRPIFATVMSLFIVIAGLVAYWVLPVSQYPDISPPRVNIYTNYSGADAQTMSRTVAAPIEDQLSGVEGLLYYTTSVRSNGDVSISCTFEVGIDPNDAMLEINNRVRTAERRLPDQVRKTGVSVRKRSEEVLLMIALTSPDKSYDVVRMADYATVNIVDDLKRIPGVGDVSVFGNVQGAMRIWVNPDKMAQLKVSVQDIEKAIESQNEQYAAGRIGAAPNNPEQQLFYTVRSRGQLLTPEEFSRIMIRSAGAKGFVRIGDVARVEIGKRSYDSYNQLDDDQCITVGVYLQTGANAMATADLVKARFAELAANFPTGITSTITDDTTVFVGASLREVAKTFMEAALLVLAVVFLFLQNWRATIIPLVAVPISLIGTMVGLWVCGFSLNTMTLFAMTLAIGIVVDDAIVVLENVERIMRTDGIEPRQAAQKAMKEVASALVAIVLVLSAVFIPVAFLGGMAGELYRQFAVTIAVSVTLSGFVALTLTPAMCAVVLKKEPTVKYAFFKRFDILLHRFIEKVVGAVGWTFAHPKASLAVFLASVIAVWGLVRVTPTSFVPMEDQGIVRVSISLPEGASLSRTEAVAEDLMRKVRAIDAVQNNLTLTGFDTVGNDIRQNAATFIIRLKHWDDRDLSADDVVDAVRVAAGDLTQAQAVASTPAPIRGLGSAAGFAGYIQSRASDDPSVLQAANDRFIAALRASPILTGIRSTANSTSPMISVSVNEAKALTYGVSVSDIYETMAAMTGGTYVNDFTRNGKINRVIIQAEERFRMQPSDLGRAWVKASNGKMMPVSAFISWERISGSESLAKMNGYLGARFMGRAVAGVSSGEAIAEVERIAAQVLPADFGIGWTDQAFQEKRLGSSASLAFIFGMLVVFLILAAQYERWSLPIAVALSVPFSVAGAFFVTWITGHANDIYFQIGLLVLIGLTAKNAILIVEFAVQRFEEGMSAKEAAITAVGLRLRPILMTSMAFILGVVPLALATGPGAAARQSMGIGVLGGMLVSTFVATVFVPIFFTWFVRKNRYARDE